MDQVSGREAARGGRVGIRGRTHRTAHPALSTQNPPALNQVRIPSPPRDPSVTHAYPTPRRAPRLLRLLPLSSRPILIVDPFSSPLFLPPRRVVMPNAPIAPSMLSCAAREMEPRMPFLASPSGRSSLDSPAR